MVSKQQKKKEAIRKIQNEVKSGSAYASALKSFRDEKAALAAAGDEREKARRIAEKLYLETRKQLEDTSKTLSHERKLREDIQNGSLAVRESLVQIRQMHHVTTWSDGTSGCNECGADWPCPTLLAIKEPEQATIAALQILERELSESKDPDPGSQKLP